MKLLTTVLLTSTITATAQNGAPSAIDPAASKMTIYAYKAGLFSFAAHDHEIEAPIAEGSVITQGDKMGVRLRVSSKTLKVLDPKLGPEKRAEVQQTMLSEKVLDAEHYPDIEFVSTRVRQLAPGRYEVSGTLRLHGSEQPLTLDVTHAGGKYTGTARFKQTKFGISPVNLAGGTIKVKDEVRVDFAVALRLLRASKMTIQ